MNYFYQKVIPYECIGNYILITHLQLEILHGVLNDVEANSKKSFFYLRNPVDIGNMDENEYKVILRL
jgi:mannitol/fructose-specific phosphotransferase system IIA component (Ntr-type)